MSEFETLTMRHPVLAKAAADGRIPRQGAVVRIWARNLVRDRNGTEAKLAAMPQGRFSQPVAPKAGASTKASRATPLAAQDRPLVAGPSTAEVEQAEHDRYFGRHFPQEARAMGRPVATVDLTGADR